MKTVLLIILSASLVASATYWAIERIRNLQLELSAQLNRSEALEVKMVRQASDFAAQQLALEGVKQSLAKAIAERDKFRQSFRGFNERLARDPETAECKMNRASAKVANRLAEATGGEGVDTPVECD